MWGHPLNCADSEAMQDVRDRRKAKSQAVDNPAVVSPAISEKVITRFMPSTTCPGHGGGSPPVIKVPDLSEKILCFFPIQISGVCVPPLWSGGFNENP